jgi:phosphoglycerol transferase MdoB-like AlkP superfamily enzyme
MFQTAANQELLFNDKISRIARKVLMLALPLLFAGEISFSLWQWRLSSPVGLLPAAIHSVVFLSFFWMSLLLAADCFSRLVAWLHSMDRLLAVPGRLFAALMVSLAWNIVVVSLVMCCSLGCYLSLSLLRFACNNMSHGFFQHLVATQQKTLVALGIFLAVSTIWVFYQSFRAAANLNLLGNPRVRRPVLLIWLALSVAFTLSVVTLNRDQARSFKSRMINQLSFKLDPLLNFGLNCYDFYRQSKYESMLLEESGLTPLFSPYASSPTTDIPKPNIIFLQIESFRGDLIGESSEGMEIVPNLNRLARQGTTFARGYAGATHTSLSNPSVPSSLYPLRTDLLVAYKATDPWPKTLIYDILKPYGYATAYIASDIESWCGMDEFLATSNLDLLVDATSRKREELRLHPEQMSGNSVTAHLVPDSTTLQTAIEWIGGQADRQKPFYLTLSLSDSHFPYNSSVPNANWFKPAGVPPGAAFNEYPVAIKDQVRNSYFNAIHGVDMLVGQLLDFLEQRGLAENTIIVVYGDHGESFYENGFPTHANLPYDTSARTCLIMSGRKYFAAKTENYPASLIDVAPTVLGRLGLSAHPNFQGIDILAPDRPPRERRCLYLHVDGLVNADGLLAAGHWKYFEDNGKGDRYLYDLATDPGEHTNLVEAQPDLADLLGRQLGNWRAAQLTYYRSPRYYTRFYPPPPQSLPGDGLQ